MAQHIVGQIHTTLIKSKKTAAVAESCTGGLASSLLTRSAGSSAYFMLGIVAYSNEAKERLLKVPPSLIGNKGAVSKQVAIQMAVSVRKIAKADLGVGITGIAGPSGGSLQKPVGTVFIAIAKENKAACSKFIFKGSRNSIQKQAALKALELLLEHI